MKARRIKGRGGGGRGEGGGGEERERGGGGGGMCGESSILSYRSSVKCDGPENGQIRAIYFCHSSQLVFSSLQVLRIA